MKPTARAKRRSPEFMTLMKSFDADRSVNDAATFTGQAERKAVTEESLGDGLTLGDQGSGQGAVVKDAEVVDPDARYRVEGPLGQGGMGDVLIALGIRI